MYDFIYSIMQFWSGVVSSFASGLADFENGSNIFLTPLTFWGMDGVKIADILIVGLSLATFALLIYFSFKIVKYCFRFFANIFGGWL